jgi:DNA-directed RNA polymerase subunit RPC12/RpoP
METTILKSTITCPECGHKTEEEMPTTACQFFYECDNCKQTLFCSYGTVACPPIQENKNCC